MNYAYHFFLNHTLVHIYKGELYLRNQCGESLVIKSGIPAEEYRSSIQECLVGAGSVPQWYVVTEGGEIIGGAGVIENDFHNRKDLTPNVCALYVEEQFRRQGIAGRILKYICDDMKSSGMKKLYLITDHTNFYEKYGWNFLCFVQEANEEASMIKMYQIDLSSSMA